MTNKRKIEITETLIELKKALISGLTDEHIISMNKVELKNMEEWLKTLEAEEDS